MRTILCAALAAVSLGCGATPESLSDAAPDASLDAPEDAPTADDAADAVVEIGLADRANSDVASVDVRDGAARDAVVRDAALDRDDGSADVVREAGADAGTDAGAMDVRDAAVIDSGGRCSEEMVLVGGRVCVDRWEASLEEVSMDGGVSAWSPFVSVEGHRVRAVSREGVIPQGYISGEQAQAACRLSGKRLCRLDEWLAACRGPANLTYPYGNTYVRRRCNEARTPHPVIQFYGTSVGVFTYDRMNNPGINMQPDSLAATGAFTGCASPTGTFDMVGNLHEWIDDPGGTFKGGFYVDAELNGHGCLYTTTAHAMTYHDYSTGFRCCADPM